MLWQNGSLIKSETQFSFGSKLGKWLYEVVRIQDGWPVFMIQHLDRFYSGLENREKVTPFSKDELAIELILFIRQIKLKSGNIRILLDLGKGDLFMMQIPHQYPTDLQYREGVKVGILEKERDEPNIKLWNPVVRGEANLKIKETRVYELMLVNHEQFVTEGSKSNLFFISNGQLFTPPVFQVLPGITREIILEICRKENISFQEKPIHLSEVTSFEAVFISGTSPGILPVCAIESHSFRPDNPFILNLQELYNKAVKQNIEETVRIYNKYILE